MPAYGTLTAQLIDPVYSNVHLFASRTERFANWSYYSSGSFASDFQSILESSYTSTLFVRFVF